MTPVTIPLRQTGPATGAELAGLVAARLCHDLVSPLGAIGNGVELLEMSGEHSGIANSPELTLIGESVRAARARVRLYRMAFGHAPSDQRVAVMEIAQLAHDYARGARLIIDFETGGDTSRIEARMLLLSLMCMDTAMPWGGNVAVTRAAAGWHLRGQASRARAEHGLWQSLDPAKGPHPAPAPSEVHFTMLGTLAAEHGRPIAWSLDAGGATLGF